MKKLFGLILATAWLSAPLAGPALADETTNPHTINSALQDLKNGNQRFVDNMSTRPNQDKALRDNLSAHGQTPRAAILSCSDSRVPVELLFDQGFGDVFVIRVAGNAPGVDETGSIEYAVKHLGAPLVLVLGHTKCGALTAAVQEAVEPGALGQLLASFKPAAQAVAELPSDQKVPAAIKKNVELGVKRLTDQSPILAQAVQEGHAQIIGAVYQIEDGRVIFD